MRFGLKFLFWLQFLACIYGTAVYWSWRPSYSPEVRAMKFPVPKLKADGEVELVRRVVLNVNLVYTFPEKRTWLGFPAWHYKHSQCLLAQDFVEDNDLKSIESYGWKWLKGPGGRKAMAKAHEDIKRTSNWPTTSPK